MSKMKKRMAAVRAYVGRCLQESTSTTPTASLSSIPMGVLILEVPPTRVSSVPTEIRGWCDVFVSVVVAWS